jgi:hypothetical protein
MGNLNMSTSTDQAPEPSTPAGTVKRNLAWALYKTLGFALCGPMGLRLAGKMLLK